jgi:hypothetical protein
MKLFKPKGKEEKERAERNKARGLHPNAILLSEMPLRRHTVWHGPDIGDPNQFPDPRVNQRAFSTKPDPSSCPTEAPDVGIT